MRINNSGGNLVLYIYIYIYDTDFETATLINC